MKIFIVYDNVTKIINTTHRVSDEIVLSDIDVPVGNTCVEVFNEFTTPAYYKDGVVLPIPPTTDLGAVWDGVNEVWINSFPKLVEEYTETIEALTTFFYEFGYAYTPPSGGSPWGVPINTWSVNRINAMIQILALSPPGLLPMKVFGSPASEFYESNRKLLEEEVTREEAQEFCLLFSNHVQNIARQRQYQLTEVRKAELLHATDPATALDNLVDLIDAGWLVDPPLFT